METGFIGALSLDGTVHPVEGMVAAILAARKLRLKRLVLPFDPKIPRIEIEELELVYVETLLDVMNLLAGQQLLPLLPEVEMIEESMVSTRDFNQTIGHNFDKRALESAASGGHYILMDGPPGCGKSLLAETFLTILPSLSKESQLEKISLYQLAGTPYSSLTLPPYRHPHHSASAVSIIGGGTNPKPGEVSLAHRGVLFLDELGEFSKKTPDMLRQPLENERVAISRIHSTVTYPAKFIFIAAMNPCPCGYYGSNTHYCTCSKKQINAYQNKLSGPLRDRFDINLFLRPADLRGGTGKGEPSETVRNRVEEARVRQYGRSGREICNGRVPYEELTRLSPLSENQLRTLKQFSLKRNLSNCTEIKIIRLARTISDLYGSKVILDESIWEAIKLNSRTDRVSAAEVK